MDLATPTVPSLKIVVVEDDAEIRQFLRESLEKIGHQVVGEAASGQEMVRMVLDLNPDVVVFDIHLPQLDGLKALAQIYQERIVAAVAITADRDQDLVRVGVGMLRIDFQPPFDRIATVLAVSAFSRPLLLRQPVE